MDNEKRPKRRVLYEFYNVLRVGWKGEVAYRWAHWRVERRVWDGLEVEAVDLVLGKT
jgi:hypothetical protein